MSSQRLADFLALGTVGDRPVSLDLPDTCVGFRWETDSGAWIWDGSSWVQISGVDGAASTIEELTDVSIDTSLVSGDVLQFNGTRWVNAASTGGSSSPGGSSGDIQTNNGIGGFGAITPGSGVATFLATPSSANLRTALTDETGTGAAVFATSPVLVTPNLGTPSAATLTSATGLPVSTGISGLGSGVATFLATPSSANLIGALTDETGTGAAVFANSPVLVTPDLGVPSAIDLTNATNVPSSVSPGGSSGDIQTNAGGGSFGAITPASGIATFLATPSSANLRAALTDEVGTGLAYFVGGALGTPASGTATNLTSIPVAQATGVLPAANGGAGTVNGILKANGSGVVSQASASTDYAGIATANTFTAAQATTPVTGGSVSGTVTPDASLANDWTYTLTGDLVIANPTNIRAGQTLNFLFTQDGSGSHTITLGSYFKFAGGTAPTWSTGAGKINFLSCRAMTTTFLASSAAIDVR